MLTIGKIEFSQEVIKNNELLQTLKKDIESHTTQIKINNSKLSKILEKIKTVLNKEEYEYIIKVIK